MKSFLVTVTEDKMTAEDMRNVILDGLGFPIDESQITVQDSVVYITDPTHSSSFGPALDRVIAEELAHPPKDIMR